jgi:anti-sigma-K factor RskA
VKRLRHDLHILTGVYAVDAIDGTERDRFEHHLNRCQPCSHEVRGLRETATRLAVAVARVPPPQLKVRVMAAAASTRQLPPAIEVRPVPSRPRTRWLPGVAVGLAAAATVVAIVLSFTLTSTQLQLDATKAQQQAVAAVLNSPDAHLLTHRTSLGGEVTVVVSHRDRKMIFTTTGLPRLPGAKVYQLWLLGRPRTRSAGLLPLPSQGRTAPVLASGLVRGDSVGVTVEPAGGTAQPTTTPIVVIPLY